MNQCSIRQEQCVAILYCWIFWLYVMKTNFFTGPKPTKPIKPTFYGLWGFMLDMFELDGGLKAQSLSKVVFSEMRDSQMGKTNLFTHPEPKKTNNKTNLL